MEPQRDETQFNAFREQMKRLNKSDHSAMPLLWALAQEDDEYPAAQARVATWVGRPPAEVGELLGEALAKLAPHRSADAACAAVRPLLRAYGIGRPKDRQRGQFLVTNRSADYRTALAAAANGSRRPATDHYYTLATLYPTLPNPQERLKALRHSLATGAIDLGLAPAPPPRFDNADVPDESTQQRYQKMKGSDQERIIRFEKEHPRRITSGALMKLDLRMRQLLERLFPEEKTDVKLARALQLAIERRQLDLDRR